jgi:outer membrane lipoprotein carrier protein
VNVFKPSKVLNRFPVFSAGLVTLVAIVSLSGMPTMASANALEQFKRFVTETRSARGEFNQRMVKGEGDKLRVSSQSSGSFAFSRPGKFIWNYNK